MKKASTQPEHARGYTVYLFVSASQLEKLGRKYPVDVRLRCGVALVHTTLPGAPKQHGEIPPFKGPDGITREQWAGEDFTPETVLELLFGPCALDESALEQALADLGCPERLSKLKQTCAAAK